MGATGLATFAVIALAAASCSGGGGPDGSITVSAASSLAGVLVELAEDFEQLHGDADVTINFASSATLANQIVEGAPSDVAAFADRRSMERLVQDSLVDPATVTVFATNDLVLVTKPGNPLGIDTPSDLGALGAGAVVALCAPEAPCGAYSAELLDAAGVDLDERRVTRTQNAGATLTAVAEGDADAAVVYRTDALRAGARVEVIEPAPGSSPRAEYPAAVVEGGSGDPAIAEAFVAHLGSSEARQVLAEAGFGDPS